MYEAGNGSGLDIVVNATQIYNKCCVQLDLRLVMRKIDLIILVLALIMLDCSSKQENKLTEKALSPNTQGGVDFTAVGDSLVVPSFEIQIDLDEKANRKITSQNETIIISADFFGTPKDSIDSDVLTELGELYLATATIELAKPGTAKFDNIRISKIGYEALADKNFIVLINVFSGRKSSNDNLLSCEILQEPISKVVGKTHTLKGSLIYE